MQEFSAPVSTTTTLNFGALDLRPPKTLLGRGVFFYVQYPIRLAPLQDHSGQSV